MSRYHQRPENAISKAQEFINVGKHGRALDTLYDVIKSKKRHHNYSEKPLEQIMFKYLELCVNLKKSHIAKEGLFQYRNMCQLTNVASLAAVVQGYLNLAEQRTEAARQESVESAAEVDDLDNLNTPEMIMLSAVSGEDAQDRSDRTILMPWVKFLWESYCQCLELLRTNIRVERLYHDIAQQAFRFCLKYQRKTEFRKLCDKLRNHLELVLKQTPSPMSINLNNPDTQQMNLDTRLAQLDSAIQMELWQEAYKAIEDIHGLMTMSKKVFQPKMMANYYQKLALVFWKSGNQLFHAAAIFKHFQLTREMKKNISPEEQGKMASRVLAACLAVPIPSHHPEFDKFIETDRTPQEKMARLAVLLSLQHPPTRQSLLKDLDRFGIVQAATRPLQDLHRWLELEFHPLKLCSKVQETLKVIEDSDEKSNLSQYLPSIKEITLVRLLKQVAQVYESICFNRLLELAPFTNSFELERVIVDCVRHNDMQIRVDHRSRTVHFGKDLSTAQSVYEAEGPHLQDMPSEQVRTQLMLMLEVLDKSLKTIHPDKMKIENDALRRRIVEAYHQCKKRDHERILERHQKIEQRKEYLEKLSISRVEEEQRKQEQKIMEKQKQEEARLEAEREERAKQRTKAKLQEIHQQHIREKVQQIAQTELGKKVLDKLDEKEIAELDTDQIMLKQVAELENEKRLLATRLKAQEKRMDHMERAKRREEIPLLQEAMKKDIDEDKEMWDQKEDDRIKKAIRDREEAIANRDRLARMKEDKDAFMSTLLKQRKDAFEAKLKEYNKMIEEQRTVRLQERKDQRFEERRNRWLREKEEEEQRRKDEEAKRVREEKARAEEERKAKEEEEYRKRKEVLDAMAAKQQEREREIEEKLAREQAEGARRTERVDQGPRDGLRDWRREDRPNDRRGEEATWRRRDASPGDRRGPRDDRRGERGPERGGAWRGGAGGGGWRERERRKDAEWGLRDGTDDKRDVRRHEDRDDRQEPDSWRSGGGEREDGPPRRGDRDRDERRGPPRRYERDDRGGDREEQSSWRRQGDDRRGPRDDRRGPREDRRGGGGGFDSGNWRQQRDDRGPRGGDRRDDRRDDRRGGDREGGWRRDDRGPRRDERKAEGGEEDGSEWTTVSKR